MIRNIGRGDSVAYGVEEDERIKRRKKVIGKKVKKGRARK